MKHGRDQKRRVIDNTPSELLTSFSLDKREHSGLGLAGNFARSRRRGCAARGFLKEAGFWTFPSQHEYIQFQERPLRLQVFVGADTIKS